MFRSYTFQISVHMCFIEVTLLLVNPFYPHLQLQFLLTLTEDCTCKLLIEEEHLLLLNKLDKCYLLLRLSSSYRLLNLTELWLFHEYSQLLNQHARITLQFIKFYLNEHFSFLQVLWLRCHLTYENRSSHNYQVHIDSKED